jgi:hypothetical protein
MAAAAERMVTAPSPRASASLIPADAISARLCSGAGPRAERSGRIQMLGPRSPAFGSCFIANTVFSKLGYCYSEH